MQMCYCDRCMFLHLVVATLLISSARCMVLGWMWISVHMASVCCCIRTGPQIPFMSALVIHLVSARVVHLISAALGSTGYSSGFGTSCSFDFSCSVQHWLFIWFQHELFI